MAKKIPKDKKLLESNNSIIAELRNDRWIYNPVVYSQISGDFTLMQQRILVGIVERLQQRILDSVEQQHKNKGPFPAIFNSEELQGNDNIELNIPTEDLGIMPSNYNQLQQAAENLATIKMKKPVYDSKGRIKEFKIVTLFPIIQMPVYNRVIDGEEVDGKRKGILRVVMLKEAIRDVFSMQHGYIKHLSQIAVLAQKKRTPRLYIYLSRYKDMGHKQVPYTDLLEYLGLTDEFYFQTNSGTTDKSGTAVNPFSEWNRVKSQVLVPVQKEMKELADRGDIDICFDFEPVYPYGKKRGTPQAINFTIIKSILGEQRQQYDYRKNTIYQWVDKYIAWCPDLSQFDLLQLVDDLSDKQLKAFIDYAYNDLRKTVERVHPDEVAPYVLTCLRRWKQQQRQRDLFSEIEAREAEERRQKAEAEERANRLIPGAYREQWEQLLQQCSPEYRAHLQKATYMGIQRGWPLIEFDTREDCEAFNEFEQKNKQQEKTFEDLRKELFKDHGRILMRGVKKKQ